MAPGRSRAPALGEPSAPEDVAAGGRGPLLVLAREVDAAAALLVLDDLLCIERRKEQLAVCLPRVAPELAPPSRAEVDVGDGAPLRFEFRRQAQVLEAALHKE